MGEETMKYIVHVLDKQRSQISKLNKGVCSPGSSRLAHGSVTEGLLSISISGEGTVCTFS